MLVPEESAAGVGLCLPLGFGGEDADALEVFRLCQSQNFNRGWFSLTLSHHFSSTTGAFRVFSVFLVNHSLWQDVLGRGDGFWQRLSSFPVRSQWSVAALLSPAPKSLFVLASWRLNWALLDSASPGSVTLIANEIPARAPSCFSAN